MNEELSARLDLHCDGVAAEGVEDVGGAGEVEHELGRAGVRHAFDLRCCKVNIAAQSRGSPHSTSNG
jgi:hypothetical protein